MTDLVSPASDFDADNESSNYSERLKHRRVILVVASIGLFGPALVAWSSIIQLALVGLLTTIAIFATLGLIVWAATAKNEVSLCRLDYAVLVVALLLLGMWALSELYFYPSYGTDESAFVQYAAQLLLHGHNPYTHNLISALTQYRVPIQFATYKLNGSIVSTLGYPALSFLLVVPAILVTHGVQAIITENVVFLAIEVILLFAFLPRAYRALGVIIALGLPFLFDYSIGGDIVTMSMPFMIIVAYRWTEIGRGGRLNAKGALRAICLGLALSISQFTWFVTPFLLAGLWRLRTSEEGNVKGTLVVARFTAVAAGIFLVVNSPFIVWSPRAWLQGVLSPLDQHAIPFGQGLIDSTVFYRIGGGNLNLYTYASIVLFVLLLIALVIYFSSFWKATFIAPSIIFLFSTRSLSEYFIMMIAMWLVSILRPGDAAVEFKDALGTHVARDTLPSSTTRSRTTRARHWKALALGIPSGLFVVLILLALSTSPPLTIKLNSVETNGQFRSIWKIHATVTNESHDTLTPHFATDASGYMTTFWNDVKGPRELRPGQQAQYTLVAPNVGSMPGVTQPFLLQAVTASPDTISSSSLFTPEQFACAISPSYVNHVVKLGSSVTLDVQLRSPYGAPVHRRNVQIALGQIIYAQSNLIPGEARINKAPEGQSPVFAITNRNGVATFHISDSSLQGGNPLYFQAYVSPRIGFPFGYSEVVSVQWGD